MKAASLAMLSWCAGCSGLGLFGLSEGPPTTRQCEHPDAWNACYVAVPAGTFQMGAQANAPDRPGHDPRALPNEGPVHPVTVSSFWMLRDEVDVSTFVRCVEAGVCREDDVAAGGFNAYRSRASSAREQAAVTGLSWAGAVRLCGHLGGRLPTEAEWEWAARGADGRPYPWGTEPGCGVAAPTDFDPQGERVAAPGAAAKDGMCRHDGPVAPKQLRGESPFGLRGMAGNAMEWVQDWYGPYTAGKAQDPTGPASGTSRVQRGGGWTAIDSADLRTSARYARARSRRDSPTATLIGWRRRTIAFQIEVERQSEA